MGETEKRKEKKEGLLFFIPQHSDGRGGGRGRGGEGSASPSFSSFFLLPSDDQKEGEGEKRRTGKSCLMTPERLPYSILFTGREEGKKKKEFFSSESLSSPTERKRG